MDPVCATIGLIAGVASIISVIGKSVCTLNALSQQFKEAELNITLLAGQLHTVRIALLEVKKWLSDFVPGKSQDEQLMSDLATSLNYCKLLVETIDTQISRFDWNDNDSLKAGSKMLLILEDGHTQTYMTWLDHQISALNLCLTAFRCRQPAEQRLLLEKAESREVFTQIKDDATSMHNLRDVESFYTAKNRLSTASHVSRSTQYTQFSKTFDFDDFLLRHKAYQNTFRSMLRRAVSPTERRPSPPPPPKVQRAWSDTPLYRPRASARDSARIDSALKEDARKKSKEATMLAIGHRHGRSAVVKQLRYRFGQAFTDAEVEQYRQSITGLALKALMAVLDYVNAKGPGLVTQSSRDQAEAIRQYARTGGPEWRVSHEIASAVKLIWRNWHVAQAFSNMQQHGQTAYYLKSIERICCPDYVPSTLDIIRAPETIETVKETELTVTSQSVQTIRIIEIKEHQAEKIISAFADVQFCLFAIDLTCYDRYLDDASGTNAMRARLSILRSICRSPWFSKSIILLVFTNGAAFARQVPTSPLSSHFEDYTGGNSVDAATKYIIKRCKAVNKWDLPLFHHTYDCSEEEAEADSLATFIRQSAASVSAVEWLREMGMGATDSLLLRT